MNANGGNWAEFAVIPARYARPIPDDLSDEDGATFLVNPATALAMVRHVLAVPRGAWLLQSAAGSTLGRMIIKLGRHDGFKTLNVVRRREAVDELKAVGGDAVISSDQGPIDEQVRQIAGRDGVRYAIDPVGGETATQIFRSLGDDGRLVLYGSLSGEPFQVDPRLVITGNRMVSGFWLGQWLRERSLLGALATLREVAALIRQGVLRSEIRKTYPLAEIQAAAREAVTPGQQGKVLLTLGER
jgi:NADPH:quinone reductase-like Zn-dependent oxidoreductase